LQNGLVSILIANFNKERYLVETLRSILDQEYQLWECIIVDDRSTDNSMQILLEFARMDARFKVIERASDIPKGANFCRNHAFSLCQGEFIQWFDSDDIMYPWFLKDKVRYLQSHPETAYVISRGEIKFEPGFEGNTKFAQTIESPNPIEDYLKFRLSFLIAGPLVRRFVFDEIGLYNPKLRRHQEWELFFRMVLFQSNWGIVDTSGFRYQVNNNSITSRFQEKRRVVESELILFLEILGLPDRDSHHSIPNSERRRLAFKYLMVASYHRRLAFSYRYFLQLCQELLRF